MDLTTFNRLTAEHQAMVYTIACRILGDSTGAADAVEKSIADLCRSNLHRLDVEQFHDRLLADVIQTCAERVRAQKANDTATHSLQDWIASLDDRQRPATQLLSQHEAIESGLRAIGVEECIVLLLHDCYHCSPGEIAAVLGASPIGVRKWLCQARVSLRNYLFEHSQFPLVAIHSRRP